MYKRILIPLDGSELAKKALVEAEKLAKVFGSEIVLFQVVPFMPIYGSPELITPLIVDEKQKETAEKYLAQCTKESRDRGLQTTSVVKTGQQVALEIIEFAKETRADLIVMCTHGRSGITRWMLGSVALKLLSRSETPILLIRSRDDPFSMGTILVGLYIACELVANVTASKPVQLGSLIVPAAIFIYALTFTLIDLINESFGKHGAQRVIAAAFLANLLLAAYSQIAIALPAAPFYSGQQAFSGVLGSTPRIVFASLTAYAVSAFIDAEIFALWRVRIRGPRWLRVLASNTVSTGVDSVIFITIAFYGIMPVWTLVQGQYLVKMAITAVSLPLIYLVRGRGGESLNEIHTERA